MYLVASRNKMKDNAIMKKNAFPAQICSVARALEVIGEWWTLLIIREAFMGTCRFSDFEQTLGIAKNVLSSRLSKLVGEGIMERRAVIGRGNPADYTLTDQGRNLLPVIITLMQWGDKWIHGTGHAPIRVLDRESGREIPPLQVLSVEGNPLTLEDLLIVPGPGANAAICRRFGPGNETESDPSLSPEERGVQE
jgi:DNA-binding HxlR family transcriptional regulator